MKHKKFIQRFQITNNYSLFTNKGYTLVELLAATSIIVIVSGLIVGILYSTLRGGNKTKVTNDVSQNGNYALSIIANTALISEDVTKVGGVAISDCTNPLLSSEKTSIEFKKADGSLINFSCDAQTQSIASTSGSITTYLIDNNSVKVDPTTCAFTCIQNNANPYSQPIINVSFTVSQRGSGTYENVATSPFNTSVTMRNYSP